MVTPERAATPDLQTLYCDHHDWLRNWLRGRLGCAQHAADLAHDTFMRLLSRGAIDEDLHRPRAYLTTIARALLIDHWRRQDIERAWLETLAAQPEAVEPSPEQRAIVLETLFEVDAMLRKLAPNVRRAFIAAQLHGATYREIAAELGVSERMVKKYMATAMLHCLLLSAEFGAATS